MLVPYKRIYGINEPANLLRANDGKLSKQLPEGTPFGLVGSSSLYKRESYPGGVVPEGKVTATSLANPLDPLRGLGGVFTESRNWTTQGSDAALYRNDEIHAIRIVITEPVTPNHQKFQSHASNAMERLRILGEFPVRKFSGDRQPTDPDGNADTSFLAKIPADVAWTFQTLDKHGMVLNMAQTWHQVRPGEIRTNCGGCHAHSQQPTLFEKTAAANPDYPVWDLTRKLPLLTVKKHDETGKKWDSKEETGVRFVEQAHSVEYHRHIKPILERSCTACHTQNWEKPAGALVLDDDTPIKGVPGSYFRLAQDNGQPAGQGAKVRFGHKPVGLVHNVPLLGSYNRLQASRYIRKLQSRRSLLVWKIFGQRLDGWSNEDHPSESAPGSGVLMHQGKRVDPTDPQFKRLLTLSDLDYHGSTMPPPEAVAGTYKGPDGKAIKVAPLTDEDRLTLVRWIDLGCPIDNQYDPKNPERSLGWMLDEGRPTLTLTYPSAGTNGEPMTRILIGMHDYLSGLDMKSFVVTADFPINGIAPGGNLASKFQALSDNRWELKLDAPIPRLPRGKLVIAVKDRQGNASRVERTFAVVPARD